MGRPNFDGVVDACSQRYLWMANADYYEPGPRKMFWVADPAGIWLWGPQRTMRLDGVTPMPGIDHVPEDAIVIAEWDAPSPLNYRRVSEHVTSTMFEARARDKIARLARAKRWRQGEIERIISYLRRLAASETGVIYEPAPGEDDAGIAALKARTESRADLVRAARRAARQSDIWDSALRGLAEGTVG